MVWDYAICATSINSASRSIYNFMSNFWNFTAWIKVIDFVSMETPPFLRIIIASGTTSTLYPSYFNTSESSANAVVFPAQGPPVTQIRVMGSSWRALLALPMNSSSRRLERYSILSASKCFSSSCLLSLIVWVRFLRRSLISCECLLTSTAISAAFFLASTSG